MGLVPYDSGSAPPAAPQSELLDVMPRPTAPATPDVLGYYSDVQRPSFGQYLGQSAQEGWWNSVAGQANAWYKSKLAPTDNTPMSTADWQASPYYREKVPFKEGMSAGEARARSEIYDDNEYGRGLMARRNAGFWGSVAGFGAQLAGSSISPESIIPFGPAFETARAGYLGRAVLQGAITGGVQAAVLTPPLAWSQNQFGDDVSFADVALNIGIGALLGGALGAAGHVAGARLREGELPPSHVPLPDTGAQRAGVDAVLYAGEQQRVGLPVDLSGHPVRAELERLAAREHVPVGTDLPEELRAALPEGDRAAVPEGLRTGAGLDMPDGALRAPSMHLYHGTSAEFDRFSLGTAGEGEGSAFYGHGINLAENPEIARRYAEHMGGKVYPVDVAARPENFLDWNKPLAQQSQEIVAALSRLGYEIKPEERPRAISNAEAEFIRSQKRSKAAPSDLLGSELYDRLIMDTGSPAAASRKLADAGIAGIVHPDESARAGDGSGRNFVVFSPERARKLDYRVAAKQEPARPLPANENADAANVEAQLQQLQQGGRELPADVTAQLDEASRLGAVARGYEAAAARAAMCALI